MQKNTVFSYSLSTIILPMLIFSSLLCGEVMASDAQHPNFNGVWVTADRDKVMWPSDNNPPYTDLIKSRIRDYQENFDPEIDDSGKFCYFRGMPWVMLNKARNYPTEIYQTEDRIILMVELYDTYRNIHIGQKTFPDNFPAFASGYSIAHWEDDELVIESKGFTSTQEISTHSNHRSEEASMVERWSLRNDPEHGEVIDIRFTITDPVVYETPVTAYNMLKRAPEGTLVGGYNCSDSIWGSHIDERRDEINGKNSN